MQSASLEVVRVLGDEYAYCIPNPICKPKYTKVKVPSTQDKQHVSWAALQSYTAL